VLLRLLPMSFAHSKHHLRGHPNALTLWFAAAWHLTSQKKTGISIGIQRVLGQGSYQTA